MTIPPGTNVLKRNRTKLWQKKKICAIRYAKVDKACIRIKRFHMDFSWVFSSEPVYFSVESRIRLTDTVTHTCYTSTVFSSLHRKACLIFLSTRVNIWHKEALDSSRTIPVRHRMGRGHERGPSRIQLAPRSSFKQPNPSSFTLTHAHTLLVYVHTLHLRCTNMHIHAKHTPLKTMCKMSVNVETCTQ